MDVTQSFVHRLTAYVIGMECYNNTARMRDRPERGAPADMGYYRAALERLDQALTAVVADILDIQRRGGIWTVLARNASLQNGFYRSYLHYYEVCLKGGRWEPPVDRNERTKLSAAEYILDGRFKRACEERAPLTQELLKSINYDIYSRIYTLLENNLLPLPMRPEDPKRERVRVAQPMKTA